MKFNKLDLVILVGGHGTRILKYTKNLPKPLIKINDRNFKLYNQSLFKILLWKYLFITGYKGNLIKNLS